MAALAPVQVALIQELLEWIKRDPPDLPATPKFRVIHESQRAAIDELLEAHAIERGPGDRYIPTLAGLRACGTDDAMGAIRRCNTLLEWIKEKVRRAPEKNPWTVAELRQGSTFSDADLSVFLTILVVSREYSLGGWGTEPNSPFVSTLVLNLDGVLDARPFPERGPAEPSLRLGPGRITRLYVDNYKCHVNSEIALAPLTVLVGPNGAGKTALFDALFALRKLLGGVVRIDDKQVFPPSTLTRWQSRPLQVLECSVSLGQEEVVYRLEVEHDRSRSAVARTKIVLEQLRSQRGLLFEFRKGLVTLYGDDSSAGPKLSGDPSFSSLARVVPTPDNRLLTGFLAAIRGVQICGLYPRGFLPEAAESDVQLDRDGANFTAWYRHLAQEHQGLYPAYLDEMSKVLDGLKSIDLVQTGQDSRSLQLTFEHAGAAYAPLRVDELSDGQRSLLALYALTHMGSGLRAALFLDEPDNYVALSEIQPWLVAMRERVGEALPQVVLATHHPEVIDYVGADLALWVSREAGGPTRVGRLEAPPEGGLRLSELVARGWTA